jgi:chromosome segregation ATPase
VEEPPLTPAEAARLLGISEEKAEDLARPDGGISPETIREGLDSTVLELARDLARAREDIGRLSGQLKEVRATNMRLQKEVKESIEERRRLTEEVLELRAAAEERLMLMERIEHIARIEQALAESEAELERLRSRGPLARLLGRR